MPAARQAGQRALTGDGDPHDGGLRAEGPPGLGDGGVRDITGRRGRGEGRAQPVEVLGPFEVDELGQGQAGALDGLGTRAGDGEEKAAVRLGIPRSSSQCTTTAPMVRSDTTSGITARARKRVDASDA